MKKLIVLLALLFSPVCWAMELDTTSLPTEEVVEINPVTTEINQLLDSGYDPKVPFAAGNTLLHVVQDIATAEQLLKADADINAQNNVGWTPLMTATIYGDIELCRYLLEQGAEIDKVSFIPNEAVVFEPYTETEKAFLEEHKALTAPRTFHNFYSSDVCPREATALHYAARQGLADIYLLLVQHEADTHLLCHEGRTGDMDVLDITIEYWDHYTPKGLVTTLDLHGKSALKKSPSIRNNRFNRSLNMLRMLAYSKDEIQEAEKWLITALWTLKEVCPTLVKQLRKRIVFLATEFLQGDEIAAPPGARRNLLALVAGRKINPQTIPKEFQPFFFDPLNYGTDSFLRHNFMHDKPLIELVEELRNHPVPFTEILQLRYDNRKLVQQLGETAHLEEIVDTSSGSPYADILTYAGPGALAAVTLFLLYQTTKR